tara:strand:+ start:219 stop:344 length:126 start_codon:yes stop_codon:yes gene_type:complete
LKNTPPNTAIALLDRLEESTTFDIFAEPEEIIHTIYIVIFS